MTGFFQTAFMFVVELVSGYKEEKEEPECLSPTSEASTADQQVDIGSIDLVLPEVSFSSTAEFPKVVDVEIKIEQPSEFQESGGCLSAIRQCDILESPETANSEQSLPADPFSEVSQRHFSTPSTRPVVTCSDIEVVSGFFSRNIGHLYASSSVVQCEDISSYLKELMSFAGTVPPSIHDEQDVHTLAPEDDVNSTAFPTQTIVESEDEPSLSVDTVSTTETVESEDEPSLGGEGNANSTSGSVSGSTSQTLELRSEDDQSSYCFRQEEDLPWLNRDIPVEAQGMNRVRFSL
ncbi:hypothetical protein R1sor_024321 [Riccia sorocarpa]|uniref:Uncharacterized protein n=1 Tax=Riccia sorocarpa TaxID=122646 RepID=A0ABD3GTE5_9MARC